MSLKHQLFFSKHFLDLGSNTGLGTLLQLHYIINIFGSPKVSISKSRASSHDPLQKNIITSYENLTVKELPTIVTVKHKAHDPTDFRSQNWIFPAYKCNKSSLNHKPISIFNQHISLESTFYSPKQQALSKKTLTQDPKQNNEGLLNSIGSCCFSAFTSSINFA